MHLITQSLIRHWQSDEFRGILSALDNQDLSTESIAGNSTISRKIMNSMRKGVVYVEDPTYFLAEGIFRDHDVDVVAIPMDDEGLRVDELERMMMMRHQPHLSDHQHHEPSLVYTIPVHHNPTGVVMSYKRRKDLIALSKKMDFYIIADEVYQTMAWRHPTTNLAVDHCDRKEDGDVRIPDAMASLDYEPYTVFGIGSFSKSLCPAIRLGWIQVPTLHLYFTAMTSAQ